MMPSQHNVTLLAEQLAQASPRRIIESAANILPGRLAVVSSFGTESAVLLKFVAEVDRSLPILFLDTLWLFKETLAYRDQLVALLGLTDVRTIRPSASALALIDPRRDLCFTDRNACCNIRKVAPLAKELEAFDGWISGRKRYHGGERADLATVESDGHRLKFNPLAHLKLADLKHFLKRPVYHATRSKPLVSVRWAACRAPVARSAAHRHVLAVGAVSPKPNAVFTPGRLPRRLLSNQSLIR